MSFSTSPARNPDTTTGPSNPDQRGKSWGKRTRSPSPPGTFRPRSATPADNNGLEAVKKRKSSPKKARPPSPRLPSHPGQSSFQPSSQPNGQLATQSAPGGQEPPQKPEGAAAAEQKPKRTAEEKVAHALARQSAWMEANGVTDVPPGPVPTSQSDLDFGRGLFLAPMVRSGTLVNRLLALQFGADLVWSPEVVDRAIIGTKRIVDERTGLVSYVPTNSGENPLEEGEASSFYTHPVEKERVIFQLGSAHPSMAYWAVKHVAQDVAGVDLNCGCPKPFSTLGGMGSNLLLQPDLLCDILRAMRKAAPPSKSVTCKIRLLPSQDATLALVRRIVHSNTVDAITVHCRTKEMRPREPALPERLPQVIRAVQEACKEAGHAPIPIVINGDAWDRAEAERLCRHTGVGSAMIARGAEANPSVFAAQPQSVQNVVWPTLIRYAIWLQNPFGNTKWLMSSSKVRPRLKRAGEEESKAARSEPIFSLPYANEDQPLSKTAAGQLAQTVSRAKSFDEYASLAGIEDVESFLALPSDVVLGPVMDVLRSKSPHTRSAVAVHASEDSSSKAAVDRPDSPSSASRAEASFPPAPV